MKQSKAGDFVAGFLGLSILDGMLYLAFGMSTDTGGWFITVVLAGLVLLIAATWMKRPFIALGIAVTAVIPLLSFGACVASLLRGSQN